MAGPVRGDVAEQVCDDALRQIIGLDLTRDRELLQFWRKPPMSADHAPDQAFMREMVEAAILAVALARRIDQRQIARLALRIGGIALVGEIELLQRDRDLLGKADADEAAGRDRVAVTDQHDRFGRGDDLALLGIA
ncbi:hypothetical protein ABH972_001075 [Bradyrhizobium ottawaense]